MDENSPFNTEEILGNGSLLKQSVKNQLDYFSMLPSFSSIYQKKYSTQFLTKENSSNSLIENLLQTNPENERNLFQRYQGVSTTSKFFDKLSSNVEYSMKQEIKKWKFVRKLRTMPATRKTISESKSICRQVNTLFFNIQIH